MPGHNKGAGLGSAHAPADHRSTARARLAPDAGAHRVAFAKELRVETTLRFHVTDDDTASALGSGSLPVLATPRLLAWCEAATCAALEPSLTAGATSVGTRVTLEHLSASPVGAELEISAASAYVDGRLHRFTVAARHVGPKGLGRVVATGEVTRVVVDSARFLGRISPVG